MHLAKALITMTCAGLFSLGIAGGIRLIYAQDTGETDPKCRVLECAWCR